MTMYESNRLSVKDLQEQEHRRLLRSIVMVTAVTVLALLFFDLFGGVGALFALICIGGAVFVAGLSNWLWKRPVRGLYVLFGAAVALDVDYTMTTTDGYFIAHYLPFWQDFTAWTHVHIVMSLAELFLALLLTIWLLKTLSRRKFRFDRGSLMLPISLYMLMILVGEFHGLGTGGSITTSLWELRAQIYMLLSYILACNLVTTRRDIATLIWILLIGAGIRAVEGTLRYFIYFRGQTLQEVNVYPHEQAFFLNGFIVLVPILFLYGGSQWMKRVALAVLPFVLFIDFATDRRAAIAALSVGLMMLLLVTLVVNRTHRRAVGLVLLFLAVMLPPYYLRYQHTSGTIAAPARALASNFHPDARDASSNQYRIIENFDIMSTMKSTSTSALIGFGFGKKMLTPGKLPDISKFYIWWDVMPHNSILWVWMRLGTVGYLLLWFMIGTAVVQSANLTRRLRDPRLQGVALFIVVMLIQEVIFGYLDLQWTNYRNLVSVGVLFALISSVSRIATKEGLLAPDRASVHPLGKQTSNGSRPLPRAVVNGRVERIRV